MNTKDHAASLVRTCLRKGADAAEVYLETSRNLSIEIRNGEVETVEESSSQGVGFRIFVKGKMASAACNDFRDEALEDAIGRAVAFAGTMTADEANVLPEERPAPEVNGLFDPGIGSVSLEAKVELAKRLESMAMRDSRITKSAGSRFAEAEGETVIANSAGVLKSYRESACSMGVSVVAEKGEQKCTGGEYAGRRNYADLPPVEEIAALAARKAYEMLDPGTIKTQRAAVIFTPDVAGAVLGGILGAINGERVLQGASFLAKSMGQKIASDLLTIVDDGLREKGPASAPFDGEGVPTSRRLIIERGVLKGFLYNTIVARRAGVASTGNASRNGYGSIPGIGPHNFYIDAGTAPPEEIIRSTKKGLLLRDVTGYGINPVNGNFSGGAEGLWIENGKVTFPVKGLTIAGTADEMLRGIDVVGKDLNLFRAFTAPTFRIASLQIGGD